MIVFSGLEFMFRFLPVFLIIYYLTPAKHRDLVLLLGSVFFYAEGAGGFVIILLVMMLLNWLLGELTFIAREKESRKLKATALHLSVLLDAAVLIVCKVLAIRIDSSLLPLGMSFYIFKMISYQADLYTGKTKERPSSLQAMTYFSMFPQITQGPIMTYSEGRFHTEGGRRVSYAGIEEGLVYFVTGLGFKLLIADRLSILWNEIGKIGYESISAPLAWLGAFGYSFQLYFDFWGYSLMAAGLGLMLGFPKIVNFKHPYAANGIADFYRRWHVTLGAWFREYVYIPLGGSRKGSARTILNLMIVWALTGLWHGGTINFLIWGIVLGLLICWEKFVVNGLMEKHRFIGHLHVWILIPLSWVVFAISDLKQLGLYFTRLFPFFGTGVAVNQGDFIRYLSIYWPYFAAAILLSVTGVYGLLMRHKKNILVLLLLLAVFWYCMFFASNSSGNAFMYFNF